LIFTTLVAAVALKCYIGGWSWWDAAIPFSVIAFWPFLEWFVHLFILHGKPIKIFGRTIDFEMSSSHRDHHHDPDDYEDSFMTPKVASQAVALTALFWWGLFPLLFPIPQAATGFAFFLVMGLHYEWCHFCAHIPLRPRTRFYRAMKRHHILHHHKNEEYWFGVTGQTGDNIMGTNPDPKDVEKSDTCRTLGL